MGIVTNAADHGRGYDYVGASQLGMRKARRCTDLFGLGLFLGCWCAMAVMFLTAMLSGDPARLWNGVDYLGNICAGDGPRVPQDPYMPWDRLTVLFLPVKVSFDEKQESVSFDEALTIGVCVSTCPQGGDEVRNYDGTLMHKSMFDHILIMGRCMPILDLYDICEYNNCVNNATSDFNLVFDAGTFIFRGIAGLANFKWIVICCCITALVLTLLWLTALKKRRLIRPFAVVSVVCLQCILIAGAVLLWRYADSISDKGFEVIYRFVSILLFVVASVFFSMVLYLRRRFDPAIRIVQLASRTQVSMPSLSFISPVTIFILAPFALITVMMATFVQTSGMTYVDELTVTVTLTDAQNTTGNVMDTPWWRAPAHIFNIWMLVWLSIWLRDVSYLVISLGCCTWYWSLPTGNAKLSPHGVLFRCLGTVLRYHSGTAALGSLLMLMTFVLNLILKPVEWGVEASKCGGKGNSVQVLMLASLAWVTQLLTSEAYVMTAMCGDSLLRGAKRALFLIKSNIFHVGAINFVSSCIMLFGKLMLTGAVLLVGWLMLRYSDFATREVKGAALTVPMFVIGFLSWVVISVFSAGIEVSMQTLLLCFCYDVYVNDGSVANPVYMPGRLRTLMEKQLTWHLIHEDALLEELEIYDAAALHAPPPRPSFSNVLTVPFTEDDSSDDDASGNESFTGVRFTLLDNDVPLSSAWNPSQAATQPQSGEHLIF
eukprot:TRINITY_DN7695_c3_g1_i1.p1 TRINITY_DN7695_c3_g1~~TRINITY_DN7695_c3_g1_i1.p1  ORF type:complete len:713 (+),score=135.06 TRINITY_DN7695_c3_g1_i1:44-2182(+)